MPKLYTIADAEVLRRRSMQLRDFALELRAAGVRLLQWRDKGGSPQTVLAGAAVLREVFAGTGCLLVMNDRADLAVLAGFGGVHVGQGDLLPDDARKVMATSNTTHAMRSREWSIRHPASYPTQEREGWAPPAFAGGVVGVSTHTEEQVRVADTGVADYIAVGPVFATGTKLNAEPVIGLDGVRRARALTGKPIVAIGGLTRENARSVLDAGADSIAVISGLFAEGETVGKVVEDFLRILG